MGQSFENTINEPFFLHHETKNGPKFSKYHNEPFLHLGTKNGSNNSKTIGKHPCTMGLKMGQITQTP
jgi:hypothetical protein